MTILVSGFGDRWSVYARNPKLLRDGKDLYPKEGFCSREEAEEAMRVFEEIGLEIKGGTKKEFRKEVSKIIDAYEELLEIKRKFDTDIVNKKAFFEDRIRREQ